MILVCIQRFGNFLPGDEVEVPDGAIFDRSNFKTKADDGGKGDK